jgi:hypothetical protein
MNGVDRFTGAIYTCQACKRFTRETGGGESDIGLCRTCQCEAEDYNSVMDGHLTMAEYKSRWDAYNEKVSAKLKRLKRVGLI